MSVKVMTWVWDHSPVAGNDRLVLLAIADCADDAGRNAWPSIRTLAHKTRLDTRTVQRIIRRLQQGGHLEVVPAAGRGGANVYTVVMSMLQAELAVDNTVGGSGNAPANCHPGKLPPPAQVPPSPRHWCRGTPGTAVPPERPYVPEPPPPPTPSTTAALAERRDQEVVVEELPNQKQTSALRRSTDGPLPAAKRRAAERAAEAMAIVTTAQWPTAATPTPTGRRLLARTVRACLDRGHTPQTIQAAMTSNLDGARAPVAVAVARLRDLAASAPEAQPAQSSHRSERERLARTPHLYVETTGHLCGACGRPETARVHPDRQPRRSARRCEHGRQPVACPTCRQTIR